MLEPINTQVSLASRKRRIAAFLIDHFVMTFLIVLLVFASLGTSFFDQPDAFDVAKVLPVMLVGFLFYFAKDSIKGISLGKWIMGIAVRDSADVNNVPSFGRLLLRNLFIIVWPVEFIVLAMSPEKKRLGDKVAHTIVLSNLDKPKKLPRILAFFAVVVAFGCFFIFFIGFVMKNSGAYKVAVAGIERNQEIKDETGGIKGYGFIPTGNVSMMNGKGSASLQIKVLGNKQDVEVNVYLETDEEGNWKIIELQK